MTFSNKYGEQGNRRAGDLLFLVILIGSLWPLFQLSVIPTLDGPSHLYNARLIGRLLIGNSTAGSLHELNSFLLPNSLGHFVLLFLQAFMNPVAAEKAFQGIYLISFALSFRYMLSRIGARLYPWSYLSIPLSWNLLFFLGFYNFCISSALALFTFGYLAGQKKSFGPLQYVTGIALTILVFFSHLFSLVVLIMSLGIWQLIVAMTDMKEKGSGFSISGLIRSFRTFAFIFIPALLLVAWYFLNSTAVSELAFRSFQDLFESLYRYELFMLYRLDAELILAGLFPAALLFLLILSFLKRSDYLNRSVPMFVIASVLLVLYFIAPAAMASGEYVNERFAFYFMLFVIAGLAAFSSALKVSNVVVTLIFVLFQMSLWAEKVPGFEDEEKRIDEFVKASGYMKNGGTYLPLDYERSWLSGHQCSYAGVYSGVVILDNYEAFRGYFPVAWKEKKNPFPSLGDFYAIPPDPDIARYESSTGIRVDFVSLWKFQRDTVNARSENLMRLLQLNYEEVYDSHLQRIRLFKRKNEKLQPAKIDMRAADLHNLEKPGSVIPGAFKMEAGLNYSPEIRVAMKSMDFSNVKSVNAASQIRFLDPSAEARIVMIIQRGNQPIHYMESEMKRGMTAGDSWVELKTALPVDSGSAGDLLKVFLWKTGKGEIEIDGMSVDFL